MSESPLGLSKHVWQSWKCSTSASENETILERRNASFGLYIIAATAWRCVFRARQSEEFNLGMLDLPRYR